VHPLCGEDRRQLMQQAISSSQHSPEQSTMVQFNVTINNGIDISFYIQPADLTIGKCFLICTKHSSCPVKKSMQFHTSTTHLKVVFVMLTSNLRNYWSLTLVRYIDGKLLASTVYRHSSLRDRGLYFQEICRIKQWQGI